MANGIQVLPTLNRFAGLGQGALNLVQGLNQQAQIRSQKTDQRALAQFIQQTQGGGQPGLPGLQTPGAGNALLQFLGAQQNPLQKQQAVANLAQTLVQTTAIGAPKPITPSQQISQKKLDRINALQAKVEAGTATEKDAGLLDKMLAGVSPVQISFGRSTAAERTAIAETEASLDTLSNLESLFNKPTTRTGPIVGRTDPTLGLIGATTDDQEAFMAATTAFKNRVIKDITGAQMSEPEAKRIMAQIPDITDPPARWKAKMAQTRRNLRVLQQKRSQVLKLSGIKSPLGESGLSGSTKALLDIQPSGASLFGTQPKRPVQQSSPSRLKELEAIDARIAELEGRK